MMTRRRYRLTFALVFALWAVFCSGWTAAWQCEGRVCAATPAGCCCTTLGDTRHAQCGDKPSPVASPSVDCSSGCGCELVITACDDHDAAKPVADVSFSSLATLLPTPVALYVASTFVQPVAYHIETRGPPCSPIAFATPSLRAPPAA